MREVFLSLQEWVEENLKDDSPLVQWVNSLEIQPEKFMQTLVDTLKNGVNNILSSTLSLTMGIVNTATNVGIGLYLPVTRFCRRKSFAGRQKSDPGVYVSGSLQEDFVCHKADK